MNNRMKKKKIGFVILLLVVCFAFPSSVCANAAEPPSFIILVNSPPEDLVIVSDYEETGRESSVQRSAWESYYIFYDFDMQPSSTYGFYVTAGGETFYVSSEEPLEMYNNTFTLDIENQTLTPGTYAFRSLLLVALRLLITLLIESVVFFLFRFKERRSWIVFLAINLITQGALSMFIGSGGLLTAAYMLFVLVYGEVFVFAAEMIGFLLLLKEHRKRRIVLYVLVSNIVSLLVGAFIIFSLPI